MQRGFHSDWPFNTHNHAAFVPEPYSADMPMHLSIIFMLSPFTTDNATLFVPRSHLLGHNYLSAYAAGEPLKPPLEEQQAIGKSGDVFIFDSRL